MAPSALDAIVLLARAADNRTEGTTPDEMEALQRIDAWGPYGYQPSLAGGIVFTIVYGLVAIYMTYKSFSNGKRWWMLATLAFGSFAECVGNGVRIYGHFHPEVVNPYIAQQVILVLTPAFIAAAHFTILTKICQAYGEKYLSPLKSKYLIPAFVFLDVASLAVQGGGSGNAAIAETNGESVSTINGYGEIVVAGLGVQLFAYVLFNAIFIMVIYRVLTDKVSDKTWFNQRMRLFLSATWISSLFVLARSAFRTAEMGIGWIGYVATQEWYYLAFDATCVSIALIILCVFSPADYLPLVNARTKAVDSEQGSKTAITVEMGHVSSRNDSSQTLSGQAGLSDKDSSVA